MFGTANIMTILYRVPALLIGLSFHEAAHAYMANRCGDPTARNLGRLSLDPLRHLDLMGTLCLLLFGFGWAKPVPVNPRNYRNPRRDEIYVSLAGIITNLIIAFVFTGILFAYAYIKYGIALSGFMYADNEIIFNFLQQIVLINIILAAFNLIPVFPLDGYHVLKNSVRGGYKFFSWMERYGQFALIALLLLGVTGTIISAVGGVIYSIFINFYSLFI